MRDKDRRPLRYDDWARLFSLVADRQIEGVAMLLLMLIAFSTNTISKIAGGFITGGTKYASRVGTGLLLASGAMWLVYLFYNVG